MRLVFGCGSARCGTKSLAALFAGQSCVGVTHERVILPWDYSRSALHAAVSIACRDPSRTYLQQARQFEAVPDAELAGDIAPWYLAYADALIDEFGAQMVCLRRDKEETVKSFLRQRFDHCSREPAKGERPGDELYVSLPKFDGDRRTSASLYWDYYYGLAEQCVARWPTHFRIFPIQDLNSDEGQEAILRFAGYEGEVQHVHVDPRYAKTPCRMFLNG